MILNQTQAIFMKNWLLLQSNKTKLLGSLIFPIMLCIMFYYYKKFEIQMPFVTVILKFVLLFTIGLLNNTTIRELVTTFVTQRQQKHRQYQMVMGLSLKVYTFANFCYLLLYSIITSMPFLVIVSYYNFGWINFYNFFVYFLSSNALTLMLTSFFSDQKIAVEVIGMVFSLTAFLPLAYDSNKQNIVNIFAEIIPSSSFALATLSQTVSEAAKFSTMSLIFVPLYCLIYIIVEYKEEFFTTVKKCFSSGRRQPSDSLMEQIELQSYQSDNNVVNSSLVDTINIENVTKKYGNSTAVKDFSLKVKKSELLGLLGRNGAGKTTLVDMITKIIRPTNGNIFLYTSNSNGRPKLGICYQNQILYEELTAISHLQIYAKLKGIQNQDEHIREIVEKVGFSEHVHKPVKQLSGGNKRKLSVSLALLGNPSIIIFDEPTSGLDPLSRRNIWSILESLKQTETTVILTTHRLDEADELADRICVIEKGEKIIEDTPQLIKEKYGQGYYLTLNFNQQPYQPIKINICCDIIKNQIPTAKILQKEHDCIKYLIDSKIEFEELTQVVSCLEKIDTVRLSLQRNSLEHSFIAIIGETQNLSQVNRNNSLVRSLMSISKFSQIKAMLMKHVLCFVRKFYAPYCLTLIIFLVILTIDIAILKKMQKQIPKPQAGQENSDEQQQSIIQVNSLLIIQIFILLTSAFISIPMAEKQAMVTKLLRTRGVNKFSYWFGSYIFDITYFMIIFFIMSLFLPDLLSGCPLILVFGTGTAIILFAYSGTLLFNKKKTANVWFTILNYLIYVLVIPFFIPGVNLEGTFYYNFTFIKYLYPYFDLGGYLIRHDQTFKELIESLPQTEQVFYVQYSIAFFLGVLIIFEGKVFERIFKRRPSHSCADKILLDNICKNYKDVKALNNVNYSVNNQRVALLGHNGAGKSTTFGLLSSQLNQTSGDLYLEGQLKKNHQEILQSTGICYQDDTLWECLKCNDIFKIFAIFLGIRDIQAQKQELLESLEFDHENWNKKFEHLSGGNKRKLCMAICLMGQPEIRLLDECSTGLDPISRLLMVKTIKNQRPGSTIFTTHSIPEAEDLCSRAIIMKQGSIQEDGKIYKIKQKYYNCFWVYLIIQDESNFTETAKQVFESFDANVLEYIQRKNLVEVRKQGIQLSSLMKLINNAKQKGMIKDFKIDEPKLEDVYLRITGGPQQQVNQLH